MVHSFNSDISRWDVSSVTTMHYMFIGASTFNSNISRWDVGRVTEMYGMFYSFNSNISNWNVGRVTNMAYMFGGASSFNQNLCPWGPKLASNSAHGTYAAGMFDSSGCPNKYRPTGPTGPWCAVTTTCTASPTASPSVSPTTSTPTPWTAIWTSGSINVAIPDFSALGATHSIDVVSPVGAVITNLRVKINLTHTSMVINVKAPNGKVLNLFYRHGVSGVNLVDTVISSQGTMAFTLVGDPSVTPFTGTFKATASTNVGPTGYVSNAASFADLYSVPSGTWTLALMDYQQYDVGTLTSWEIEFF